MRSSAVTDTRVDHKTEGRAPAEQPAPQPDGPERDRIAELETELGQMRERYLRARADLENYRKRAERDTERHIAQAREAMLLHWLEAIDSVERAIRLHTDPAMVEGLHSVLEQMDATLARHGVTRIDAAGQPFDPERHEAVSVQTSDTVPDRTVLDVARSGYAIDDRVLRPAQVVVSRSTGEGGDG
jgi:molecular chaperone GrpE